jgi:hypothetical protein
MCSGAASSTCNSMPARRRTGTVDLAGTLRIGPVALQRDDPLP